MRPLSRRSLLLGSTALGLVLAGGIVAWRRDASAAREAAELADAVRADYLAGRVTEFDGWILSDHEAARLPR